MARFSALVLSSLTAATVMGFLGCAGTAHADATDYLERVTARMEGLGVYEDADTLLRLGYAACGAAAGGGDTGDAMFAVKQGYGPMPERMADNIVLTALAFLCPEYGDKLGR